MDRPEAPVIHLVQGTKGVYEDRRQWIVCAFADLAEAHAYAERCNLEAPAMMDRVRAAEHDYGEQQKLCVRLRLEMADPFFNPDSWEDAATYKVITVAIGKPPLELAYESILDDSTTWRWDEAIKRWTQFNSAKSFATAEEVLHHLEVLPVPVPLLAPEQTKAPDEEWGRF